jgi:hypothetical protein
MLACGTAGRQILPLFSDLSCFQTHMLLVDDLAAQKTHPEALRLSVKMSIRFRMHKHCKRGSARRYLALSKSSLLASGALLISLASRTFVLDRHMRDAPIRRARGGCCALVASPLPRSCACCSLRSHS